MVKEMRKVIRASWIVNIKNERVGGGSARFMGLESAAKSKGPCERAFMASNSGR